MDDKKILIISMDGMPWSVLNPLIDSDVMPNLKNIIRDGCASDLLSVIPPVTAPAWVSFMTGKNPHKHCVFDFFTYDRSSNKVSLVNSTNIRSETIWDILSKNNKKVVVMNLPMMYPPPEVNGVVVSGFDTPAPEAEYTYPKDVKDRILSIWSDYKPSMDIWSVTDVELKTIEYLEKIIESIKLRVDVGKYFMSELDWDLFMIHFQEFDFLFHAMWSRVEKSIKSNSNDEISNKIREVFSVTDALLGELFALAEKHNAVIFILSDHGFGPHKAKIFPNYILKKNRYLHLNRRAGILNKIKWHIKSYLFSRNIVPLIILYKKIKALFVLLFKSKNRSWKRVGLNVRKFDNIDWNKTKAIVVNANQYGLLYINHQSKLVKDNLIDMFKNLADRSGKPLIKNVLTPEQAYGTAGGRCDVPDLILIPEDGYSVSNAVSETLMSWSDSSGIHTDRGILIVNGVDIQNIKNNPKLIDIAPTILYLFGIDIPEDMDGEVLFELPGRRVRYSKSGAYTDRKLYVYSKNEEEDIKRRLKDIGYL